MNQSIVLGTTGWDRPEWSDIFYPADMPEAWRLTFYNTQFDCVFLAAPVWRQTGATTLEQWAADTHEHFVFLLEDARQEELPGVLLGRSLGIGRDDPRLVWFDRGTPMRTLAEGLAHPNSDMPQYLLSRDGDLGQIEQVRTLLELMGL